MKFAQLLSEHNKYLQNGFVRKILHEDKTTVTINGTERGKDLPFVVEKSKVRLFDANPKDIDYPED
jgi:hypothetical protein